MKESVVVGVLRYIRAEIIRDGQDGLEHVEALLRTRGVDPETLHVPRKAPKRYRRGELAAVLMRMLRDGPRPGTELVAAIAAANDLGRRQAFNRVYPVLYRLRDKGLVTAEKDGAGRYVWGLAP